MITRASPSGHRSRVLAMIALTLLGLTGKAGAADTRKLPLVYVSFAVREAKLRYAKASTIEAVAAALTDLCAGQLPYWRFTMAPADADAPARLDVAVEMPTEGGFAIHLVAEGPDQPAPGQWIPWIKPADDERSDAVPDEAQWPTAIGTTVQHWLETYRTALAQRLASVAPLANEVQPLPGPRGALPFARESYPCLCRANFHIVYQEVKEGTRIRVFSEGTQLTGTAPDDDRVVVRHRSWEDYEHRLRSVDTDPPPSFATELRPLAVHLDPVADELPLTCNPSSHAATGLPHAHIFAE